MVVCWCESQFLKQRRLRRGCRTRFLSLFSGTKFPSTKNAEPPPRAPWQSMPPPPTAPRQRRPFGESERSRYSAWPVTSGVVSRHWTHASTCCSDERQPIRGAAVARNCWIAIIIRQRNAAIGQAKTRQRRQARPLSIAKAARCDRPCHRDQADQDGRRAGGHKRAGDDDQPVQLHRTSLSSHSTR